MVPYYATSVERHPQNFSNLTLLIVDSPLEKLCASALHWVLGSVVKSRRFEFSA